MEVEHLITYNESKWLGGSDDSVRYVEGACLSTDTKPTSKIANGSCLIEMDTGKVYFYDQAGGTWREFGGAS